MEVEPITLPESPVKPSKPFFALVLSFVLPGVGQVYNGQLKKGILLFALLIFMVLFLGVSRLAATFHGLVSGLAFEIVLRLYAMIDAFVVARKNRNQPQTFAPGYVHLVVGIMLAIPLSLNAHWILRVRAFTIPSTSNEPTIKLGDQVIVDEMAYGDGAIGAGDLVAYKGSDGLFYISRIIGTPGDRLDINKDIPTINGKPFAVSVLSELSGDAYCPVPGTVVQLLQETLPTGYQHFAYRFKVPFDTTKTNIKGIVVPEGCYYLMSDNRDCSMDSRYKGFIKRSDILGPVIFCYWSKDITRISRTFRYQ
jgi:signal peptidase I